MNSWSTNKIQWVYHIGFWAGYTIAMHLLNILAVTNSSFGKTIIFQIPIIATFYLVAAVLSIKKKTTPLWGIVTFFSVFTVMAAIAWIYIYKFLPKSDIHIYKSKELRIFMADAILYYIRIFAFALVYVYIKDAVFKKEKISLLEKEKQLLENQKMQNELEKVLLKQQNLESERQKLQYEYAFLRAQVNPHFLHNTLNVLFSQAMTYSKELANNILKLSGIMRYSMESVEFDSDKVPVQKELEHLQNVIEVNNLRFGDSNTIHYNVEGPVIGQMVPPLSLITIVENAFKYGDIKDPASPLTIKVLLKPGEVYFYCKNKKKQHNLQISSSNIGITNLSRRLDAAFKGKYTMEVKDEPDTYTFELNVKS